MKTAHYTFTTWSESAMASGFDGAGAAVRQSLLLREPERKARTLGGDNVIDLTAWRAANLAMPEEEEDESGWSGEEYEEEAEPELYIPAPRPRKSRRAAFRAELAATVGVAATALAVILWVLVF